MVNTLLKELMNILFLMKLKEGLGRGVDKQIPDRDYGRPLKMNTDKDALNYGNTDGQYDSVLCSMERDGSLLQDPITA